MQPRITINIGESPSSAQLRRLIRDRHAAWSQETFGDVGPVGPLKHLAKEALEAAAAPDDLSEWADLQFLLWDAQRRAGISDGEITAAMEEKLKVNMARQWPDPKDGEPRQHIKPEQVVLKDHQIRELVNNLRDVALEYHGTQQLRERIAHVVRAAMQEGE
ncbi:dATP/dGTP pyrophosphohydrolase domain-containing protein [Enterobacter hormaechei]